MSTAWRIDVDHAAQAERKHTGRCEHDARGDIDSDGAPHEWIYALERGHTFLFSTRRFAVYAEQDLLYTGIVITSDSLFEAGIAMLSQLSGSADATEVRFPQQDVRVHVADLERWNSV